MRVKKNPKADLSRDSGLFFVIGLTIVLFVTWRALEYKTYDNVHEEIVQLVDAETLDEDVPKTEFIRTAPPPPPPAAPEVIEVIDDEEEVEETIIESTEISQETIIAEVDLDASDLDVEEEDEVQLNAVVYLLWLGAGISARPLGLCPFGYLISRRGITAERPRTLATRLRRRRRWWSVRMRRVNGLFNKKCRWHRTK